MILLLMAYFLFFLQYVNGRAGGQNLVRVTDDKVQRSILVGFAQTSLSSHSQMSKILEKTGGCWNDVDSESIGPENKVSLYYLKRKGELFRNIPKHIWNEEVKNAENLMLVESDSTKTMCFNEEVRDATDDLCDILSHWNTFLLEQYNDELLENDRFENIKDLLNSNDQTVWKRIEEKARDLGGV
ncbi:hypothetical protein GLOIN_2v1728575, partial [Rhizophagus irregularis DAOM 181602=DAOM 197198]